MQDLHDETVNSQRHSISHPHGQVMECHGVFGENDYVIKRFDCIHNMCKKMFCFFSRFTTIMNDTCRIYMRL